MQPSPVLPTTFPAVQTEFCIFIKENDDWKLLHRDHLYNTSVKGVGRWVHKTAISADGQYQRSYTRWLYKRIYKTEMKFWAVLGSRGCREKKTVISKQLFEVGFSTFCGQFFFLNLSKNIFASTLKSYII